MVSVEEYFSTDYVPSCEYVNGELVPRALPCRKHAYLQARLAWLISKSTPDFGALLSVTLILNPTFFLIPDILAERLPFPKGDYPTEPVHLCVEILSPEETLEGTARKCQAYLNWGVPHVWIVDPESRRAWQLSPNSQPVEVFDALTAGPISVPLSELP